MTIFTPSSRLLTSVTDPGMAKKLVLASSEWFNLQNHVQAVLALPFDFEEYEERYGTASSGYQMKECFDAMRSLQSVTAKFGNPKSLRGKIMSTPDFLAKSEMPENDLFSATAWTIQCAHQDTFSLASLLNNIPQNAIGVAPGEVVTGIKSLFLDTDQTVDKLQQTIGHLDALIREYEAINAELANSQEEMKSFTASSSKTRASLNTEIGELEKKIAQLEKDRDSAYDKWLGLTISACVVPAVISIVGVGIMIILAIPTDGASFAIGGAITAAAAALAGTGLGIAAGIARTAYDDLVKEVASKNEFRQKRICYRHDLGALDNLMNFSVPAASGCISQIRVIRDAWSSLAQEIRFKVSDLSVSSLKDGPWLDQESMRAAAAKWTTIDDALKAFTISSFVDSNAVAFGSSLPQDDTQWETRLRSQFAA